jgi:hypothetical protein
MPAVARMAGLGVLLLLCSCSILGLKRQVTKMEGHGAVTLQITPPPQGANPTYALAWTPGEDGGLESAGFQRLRPDGLASFNLLTNRTYRVGAFTDENGNGKYDAGEPGAVARDVHPFAFGDPHHGGKLLQLSFTRDLGLPAGTVIEVPKENEALGTVLEIAVGDVVKLDDPRFVSDAGSDGLWRPLDFLSENTLGIYFTEPYDPKRMPVVFVYGIGGSPQDWRYLMEHFDRSRYQFWFYHYPSGMRLERSARALATGLLILKERYEFAQCLVVAHSMGGLVSGSAIRQAAAKGTNFIPEFVTISTPWGGHKAAELGVRHLRKPVPSWVDVAPNSDFLKALYAQPLPPGTRHDLIYGEIPSSDGVEGKDDSVVTVESELEPRIRKNAASVTHFPYGHVEILEQPQTQVRLLEFLSQ